MTFAIESLFFGWGIDYRDVLGYRDRRSAVERLRIAGGLEEAFSDELGPLLPVSALEPGFIAYFPPPGESVGIVMGNYIAIKHRSTIYRVDLDAAQGGWSPWAAQS